jgi:hypothetical protein
MKRFRYTVADARGGAALEPPCATREALVRAGVLVPACRVIPPRIPCTHAPMLALDDAGRLLAGHEIATGGVIGDTRTVFTAREAREAVDHERRHGRELA